jgi:hypothetical protein
MSRIRIVIAALLVTALFATPAQAGRILGPFTDGVYENPEKIFTVRSPFPDKPAAGTEDLRSWFRETGFPKFFVVSLPQASILRDGPGEIAGNPAWIAVAHPPGGSPLGKVVHGADEPIHADSWRGMAIVAHDQRFYVLMTELRVEALATPDWKYDATSSDWNQFLPQLVDLYQRIDFLKQ